MRTGRRWAIAAAAGAAVALGASGAAVAATATYDFESQVATNDNGCFGGGTPITSLSIPNAGITATITRESGASFDVATFLFPGDDVPATWGVQHLCPSPFVGPEAFIVNFSPAVDATSIEVGDFANPSDTDTATMEAYSGPSATGTLLDTDSSVVPDDGSGNLLFTSVSTGSPGIASIKFSTTGVLGSDSFPNSVYWDNLTASTAPPTGTCSNTPATVPGTVGTPGDDVIVGTAGNDTITGGGGNDLICAGDGNDKVFAGEGDDRVFGGAGNDNLNGEAGDDKLFGETGDDKAYGASGDDVVFGNDGTDFANGGSGRDEMNGGKGDDTLEGSNGDDFLQGSDGNDALDCGFNFDGVEGGAGTDTFAGCEIFFGPGANGVPG